jgi:hypothetical protein
MALTMGPYGAFLKIKEIPGAVKFLGGESAMPRTKPGGLSFVASRAPVGEDGPSHRFPALYMVMDEGIIPGAHQSAVIAGLFSWACLLQDAVIAKLTEAIFQTPRSMRRTAECLTTRSSAPDGMRIWYMRKTRCCRSRLRKHGGE